MSLTPFHLLSKNEYYEARLLLLSLAEGVETADIESETAVFIIL